MLVPLYNALKGAWSTFNNAWMWHEPRSRVARFETPQALAVYIGGHLTYTGDPLNGAADFYIDPERLQAAIDTGPEAVKRLAIDCDDYATYAYASLRQIPGVVPYLFTLRDGQGWMHHVICCYTMNGICGAIDTNGHRLLPDLKTDTLLATWTRIYGGQGANYIEAVPTPYIFR